MKNSYLRVCGYERACARESEFYFRRRRRLRYSCSGPEGRERAPQTNGRRVTSGREGGSERSAGEGRESRTGGSSRTTDLGSAEAEETRSAGESTFTTAMLRRSAQLTTAPCSLERSNESVCGSHIAHAHTHTHVHTHTHTHASTPAEDCTGDRFERISLDLVSSVVA